LGSLERSRVQDCEGAPAIDRVTTRRLVLYVIETLARITAVALMSAPPCLIQIPRPASPSRVQNDLHILRLSRRRHVRRKPKLQRKIHVSVRQIGRSYELVSRNHARPPTIANCSMPSSSFG
jgi:hypothetical protein